MLPIRDVTKMMLTKDIVNLKDRNLTEVYFVCWFLKVSLKKKIFITKNFETRERTLPTQNASALIISVKT